MQNRDLSMWILAATGVVCWMFPTMGGVVKNNIGKSNGIREILSVVLMIFACLFVLWLTGGTK